MTHPHSSESSATAHAVVVRDIHKSFSSRDILKSLSLEVKAGEFVALIGASGSGKTTLLRILAGLERIEAGQVKVPEARSVVFQEPRLGPHLKVWRNVVLGLSGREASRIRAQAVLDEVGLSRHADSWPRTLSGGEAQRVALARALVRQPDLLLLDEPFAALDALTRIRMHELVAALCKRHRPAVVLVTHDVDEAILLADRVVVLVDGLIGLNVPVDLPRPRSRDNRDFETLRRTLLAGIGLIDRAAVQSDPAREHEPATSTN